MLGVFFSGIPQSAQAGSISLSRVTLGVFIRALLSAPGSPLVSASHSEVGLENQESYPLALQRQELAPAPSTQEIQCNTLPQNLADEFTGKLIWNLNETLELLSPWWEEKGWDTSELDAVENTLNDLRSGKENDSGYQAAIKALQEVYDEKNQDCLLSKDFTGLYRGVYLGQVAQSMADILRKCHPDIVLRLLIAYDDNHTTIISIEQEVQSLVLVKGPRSCIDDFEWLKG